jgi:hypothetical protein
MRRTAWARVLAGVLTMGLVPGLAPTVASAGPRDGAAPVSATSTTPSADKAGAAADLAALRRAGRPWVTVSSRYARDWSFRSAPLNACIHVTVDGTATAQRQYAYTTNGKWYSWRRARLTNPTIKAEAWPLRGAGCDSTRTVKMRKWSIRQDWYESHCDLDVGIAAGYPWGISVSPTRSCKKANVGRRSTSAGAGDGIEQYNSGTPVRFSGMTLSQNTIWLAGNVRVTAYRKVGSKTRSDSFAADNNLAAIHKAD